MTSIDLSDNSLTSFATETFDVSETFSLANNSLSGTVPPAIVQWTFQNQPDAYSYHLHVDLSRNDFSGTLPNIRSPSIDSLNVSRNRLSAPTLETLVNISAWQLIKLDVSHNLLNGTLPERWLEEQFLLAEVFLEGNRLTGSLPQNWSSVDRFQPLSACSLCVADFVFPSMTDSNDNHFCGWGTHFSQPLLVFAMYDLAP